MKPRTVAQAIVSFSSAIENCKRHGNREWLDKHEAALAYLARNLPSGSGIDSGTKLLQASDEQITLSASFHHMDEQGGYDGWTDHTIIVRPAFDGLDIRVMGRNRNDIKDYLHEVYDMALNEIVDEQAIQAAIEKATATA